MGKVKAGIKKLGKLKLRRPLLNQARAAARGFIEEFIVDIPEEKKAAARKKAAAFALDMLEAGAKGFAEGTVEGFKS